MRNIWILVYRGSIEEHNESDNLSEVLVTREFAEKYFNERILKGEDDELTFEEFLNEYTADWTEDFYEYAMEHNAVIEIENW